MNNQETSETKSIDNDKHENKILDCSKPEVTTKYRNASDIANEVLKIVVNACKPEADIATLCKMGDSLIESKVENLYNKKDKGCHIDGFIAVAGHTIVLTEDEITGRTADVIRAAWTAADAALKTIKVGVLNTEVTKVMNLSVEQYKCKMVEGIHSHHLKQHVIDGVKSILSKETLEEKSDVFAFGENEVYGIDVIVSTGEGKLKESEYRTTVFKRDVEVNHTLKTQLARQFLREATNRYPLLPFSIRAIEDEKLCRIGIMECTRHGLFQPIPTYKERSGEILAQFKFTVMLLQGGTKKVTGLPLNYDLKLKSNYEVVDEELKTILSQSIRPKKKKNNKKLETAVEVEEEN